MAKEPVYKNQAPSEIAEYHNDAVDALNAFLQSTNKNVTSRFRDCLPTEYTQRIDLLRADRIQETELRSSLALLASIEAALRIDYVTRVKQKHKDRLSRDFRALYKKKEARINLDNELLDVWMRHHPNLKTLISELRGALHYRHWLAHGRYWQKPQNNRYDYPQIYTLAEFIFTSFMLLS